MHGKAVLRKQLRRSEMAKFFANLEPCLIGMEACGSSHHWARKLGEFGHTVKLMSPQFVKPYVKTNKHDMADAEAICEAVSRPNMRFVPIKNIEQQAILSVHRARQGFVKARTAQANQMRGLLSEFGIVMPQGIRSIVNRMPDILEDAENGLPGTMRQLLEKTKRSFQGSGSPGGRAGVADQAVAQGERSQSKTGSHSRHWPDHGERHCGNRGKCCGVQERQTTFGMVGIGSQTTLQWWQADIAWHQQTWRHLPAHFADSRGTSSHSLCREQGRARKLVTQADNTAQQEYLLLLLWRIRMHVSSGRYSPKTLHSTLITLWQRPLSQPDQGG